MGQDEVSGGVSVLCWLAAPIAIYILWEPPEIYIYSTTPGIRPNASGAATVSPDGKQVGKNFITNLIIIIKVCYLSYFCRISLVCHLETFNVFTFKSIYTINEY